VKLVSLQTESPPRAKRAQLAPDEERLIKLAAGAEMFDVSPDAIRKRLAPYDGLTIVDASPPGAQRRSLRLVYSECVALRDKLIEDGRQRVSIERMLEAKRRRSQLRGVVNG